MCMCAQYMVANPNSTLLLKNLTLFWNLKTVARVQGLSYSSLFLDGHLSTHYFRYLGHLSIFSQLFFSFLSFFMNNFCIAPCLFSATKLLRDSNKNLEHLFDGYHIKTIFGVNSQCRSKTFFFGGSRWNGMFLCLPRCSSRAYVGGVYVFLILRAWQTSHKASTKLD